MFELCVLMGLPMFAGIDLQLFAGGFNVNATTVLQNQNSASDQTARSATNHTDMSDTMKTYYDTELLENAREKLIFQQLGRKMKLPANHGRVIEWRKWETLPDVDKLTEGVIPSGKALGMTSIQAKVEQYGEYVAVTDILELHAIDDVILGATEELGAASGLSYDKLVRSVLRSSAHIMYADTVTTESGTAAKTSQLSAVKLTSTTNCNITADTVNKAVVHMRKHNVPFYSGNDYLMILHPSCTYDLRKDKDWVNVHQYSAPEEIFNGEIGKLHGMRFIESTLCPVIGTTGSVYYESFVLGKDAFGVIDPAGGGMETIVKSKEQVGGPLNQFSTIGVKFEMGAQILYPERLMKVISTSSYSDTDQPNIGTGAVDTLNAFLVNTTEYPNPDSAT